MPGRVVRAFFCPKLPCNNHGRSSTFAEPGDLRNPGSQQGFRRGGRIGVRAESSSILGIPATRTKGQTAVAPSLKISARSHLACRVTMCNNLVIEASRTVRLQPRWSKTGARKQVSHTGSSSFSRLRSVECQSAYMIELAGARNTMRFTRRSDEVM